MHRKADAPNTIKFQIPSAEPLHTSAICTASDRSIPHSSVVRVSDAPGQRGAGRFGSHNSGVVVVNTQVKKADAAFLNATLLISWCIQSTEENFSDRQKDRIGSHRSPSPWCRNRTRSSRRCATGSSAGRVPCASSSMSSARKLVLRLCVFKCVCDMLCCIVLCSLCVCWQAAP